MTNTLVACFSATGTTARVGMRLAALTGSDFYEIRPAVPYTQADLDWMDALSRSTVEMNDPAARPALSDTNANVAGCDTILLGFPIWWYVAPAIVSSFLEAYDFTGKRIVVFATSGGSGLHRAAEALRTLVPGARLEEGEVFSPSVSDEQLLLWLRSL